MFKIYIILFFILCFIVNCNFINSEINESENKINLTQFEIKDLNKTHYTFNDSNLILFENNRLLQISRIDQKVKKNQKININPTDLIELINGNNEIGLIHFDSELKYRTDIIKPIKLLRFNAKLELIDSLTFYYPKNKRVLEEDFNYKSYYFNPKSNTLIFNKKYCEIEYVVGDTVDFKVAKNKLLDIKTGEIYDIINHKNKTHEILNQNKQTIFKIEDISEIRPIKFSDASIYDGELVFNTEKLLVIFNIRNKKQKIIPFFDYDCSNRFQNGIYQLRGDNIKWIDF